MKKHILLISIFFCFSQAFSQFTYERYDSAQVTVNGKTLKFPFVGGMNAPQFSEIDLNLDGTMDLLVFDRSGDRVLTFINEGIQDSVSYIYKPEYESKIPRGNSFLLARDFNCDGKMDLFSRRTGIIAYENTSSGNQLSFSNRIRVQSNYRPSTDDISIGSPSLPAFEDIDKDGDIDIIVSFGLTGQMFEYHKNTSIENTNSCGLEYIRKSKCWGKITESNSSSTIYLDSCRYPDFEDAELSRKGMKGLVSTKSPKHGNASISLYDINDDGGMDMVLGDDGSSSLTALFNADSVSPHENSFFYDYDTLFPSFTKSVDLRLFPAAYFLDVNNDSVKDMIVATNNIGKLPNEFSHTRNNIHFYKGTGDNNSPFEFQDSLFMNLDFLDFGSNSAPAFFDYNNDGLKDILIANEGYIDNSGNPVSQLALLQNTGTLSKPSFELINDNFANISELIINTSSYNKIRNSIPALYDIDGDGDEDLIIGDLYGNLHFFEDTSNQSSPAEFKLKESPFQGIKVYQDAAPCFYDVNNDSLVDLVIGSSPGELQLNLNLGTATNPIFNLDVKSINWVSGNTIRYYLNNNPNLNLLKVGQIIDINNSTYSNNGVPQEITAIDNNQKFIDCEHPFRSDNTNDEVNSPAVIDYSIKQFGGISLTKNNYNGHPIPFVYKEQNELKLVLGTRDGRIFFYDSIDNNLEGEFLLLDSNYLTNNNFYGYFTTISGTDFNNDGKIDFVMGNQNGGLNLFQAKYGTNINEYSRELGLKTFSIFPNPAKEQFKIKFNHNVEKADLKILDLKGKLIYNSTIKSSETIVNSNSLSEGIYFVTITNKFQTLSKKLIIIK